MSFRTSAGMWALTIGVLSGCPTPQADQGAADYRAQAVRTKNGVAGNGIGGNGVAGNGIGGNGVGGNGVGGNGIGGNGIGGNGTGGNGTGGNGIGGNGTGGNGTGGNGTGGNGTGGNGTGGNGVGGNGVQGTGVEGLNLTSVTYTSQAGTTEPITGFWLNGSELNASTPSQSLKGKAVAGMEFHYSWTGNTAVPAFNFTVRIDAAAADSTAKIPAGQANDVWMYNMFYRQDGVTPTAAWQPLCLTETNQPDQAVMLSHRWDPVTWSRIEQPTFVTFACRDFALAKCARLGYRPWAKATSCTGAGSHRTCADISLADHHQSCTRMMRADYCGTGKSYTVNGTLIDLYDYLQPPVQVPETSWDIEARWTPTGAICINEPRHPELVGKWRQPDCNGDGKPDLFPACGQSDNRYSGKGLVVDRFDDDQSATGK